MASLFFPPLSGLSSGGEEALQSGTAFLEDLSSSKEAMADFEELQRRGDAEKEGTSPSGDHMPYANFVNWINKRTEEPQRNMMKKDLSLRLSGRWICRECCKGAGVHDPEHNPGKDTGDDTGEQKQGGRF